MADETNPKLPALKFVANTSGCVPSQTFLEPALLKELAQARRQQPPTVCVIGECGLATLRAPCYSEFLEDRNHKNPAKPLARLLLGREKIPFIDGAYTSAGQLVRSVRRLLDHAGLRAERNHYFIGVPHAVFTKLWDHAGRLAQPKPGDKKRAEPAAEFGDPDASWESLLRWLRKRYGEPPERLRREVIGSSDRIELVRCLIARAAAVDFPVLIEGDTGTGKEIMAREIHYLSKRADHHFVAVNCSAIPEALLESELFGYTRGAFTGAGQNKPGLWEVADRGTLFLDEIGEMSLAHQSKILRVLEQHRYRPVGASTEFAVNVRIIAATNRNLADLIRQSRFRDDLYYRLCSLRIHTPSLQEHPEDIPALANHFWSLITDDKTAALPKPVLKELQGREWRGNARQLRAALNQLYTMAGKTDVDAELLRYLLNTPGGHLDQVARAAGR